MNPSPDAIGRAAADALLFEARLTPKPGLVDANGPGAHADMDLPLLERSAEALLPFFRLFAARGAACASVPPDGLLHVIRADGVEAERTMFAATNGVNTHKGAIFLLGALCFSAGRRSARRESLVADAVARDAGAVCRGVTRELGGGAGRAFSRYGAAGARGEAEAGYPGAVSVALPAYAAACAHGSCERDAWLLALLALIGELEDANVLARCGAETAAWLRRTSRALAAAHPSGGAALIESIVSLDGECRRRNASPGGAADLLACTAFLRSLERGLTGPPITAQGGIS